MNDDTEMWREWKKMKQEQRATRRNNAPDLLKSNGIQFTEHNYGAHLIVEGPNGLIDFWPGTTKWWDRAEKEYRHSISALIKHVLQK